MKIGEGLIRYEIVLSFDQSESQTDRSARDVLEDVLSALTRARLYPEVRVERLVRVVSVEEESYTRGEENHG